MTQRCSLPTRQGKISARPATRRGMAMVLVMITVGMAVVLGLSFLNAQTTSGQMSQNITKLASARAIAESGLTMAFAHINADANWRTNLQTGTWVTSQAFAGGTFSITAEDGQDTDGDGVVEGDGDLSDDPFDLVTVTATGSFQGTTHTVRAVATPTAAAVGTVLFVVPDASSLTSQDAAKNDVMESWGYDIMLLTASASQSEYDSAVGQTDVVFISEEASSI